MPNHYCLCQHGLLGSERDFQRLVEFFESGVLSDRVKIVLLTSNVNLTDTLSGIEAAGERCYNEIVSFFEGLETPNKIAVSFLGHSMGGLFLRYALRKIAIKNPSFWDDRGIQLCRMFFIATPHCGTIESSWFIRMSSQYLLRHVFKSIDDLCFSSSLLETLADIDGIRSLEAFEQVFMYGNAYGDKLVSASSALALSQFEVRQESLVEEGLQISEYISTADPDAFHANITIRPGHISIIRNFASLTNVTRYLVKIPSSLPQILRVFDNSAHTKIISHAIMDREKVGIPIIEHIASFFQ